METAAAASVSAAGKHRSASLLISVSALEDAAPPPEQYGFHSTCLQVKDPKRSMKVGTGEGVLGWGGSADMPSCATVQFYADVLGKQVARSDDGRSD